MSILDEKIELRSLYSRVVCAGVAKLVVFYKIVYGMHFPSTAATPERKSSNNQHTDLQSLLRPQQRRPRYGMYVSKSTQANPPSPDQTPDLLTPTLYWPMVESSLGIVGACLPLLRPLFINTSPKTIFSSLRTMISPLSFRNSDDAGEMSRDYIHLEAGKVWPGQHRHIEEGTE